VRGLRFEARLEITGITRLHSLSAFSLEPPTFFLPNLDRNLLVRFI